MLNRYLSLILAFAFVATSCNDSTPESASVVTPETNQTTPMIDQAAIPVPADQRIAEVSVTEAEEFIEESPDIAKAKADLAAVNEALGNEWSVYANAGLGLTSVAAMGVILWKSKAIASGLSRLGDVFAHRGMQKIAHSLKSDVESLVKDANAYNQAVRTISEQSRIASEADELIKNLDLEASALTNRSDRAAANQVQRELGQAHSRAKAARILVERNVKLVNSLSETIFYKHTEIISRFSRSVRAWTQSLTGKAVQFANSKLALRGVQTVGILGCGIVYIEAISSIAHIGDLTREKQKLVQLLDPKTKEVIAEEVVTVEPLTAGLQESTQTEPTSEGVETSAQTEATSQNASTPLEGEAAKAVSAQ